MANEIFVVTENEKPVAKFNYRPDCWDFIDFKKKAHPDKKWQWFAEQEEGKW